MGGRCTQAEYARAPSRTGAAALESLWRDRPVGLSRRMRSTLAAALVLFVHVVVTVEPKTVHPPPLGC